MIEPEKKIVAVVPLKNGLWRVAKMTPARHNVWCVVWKKWYGRVGWLLALAPGMWRED